MKYYVTVQGKKFGGSVVTQNALVDLKRLTLQNISDMLEEVKRLQGWEAIVLLNMFPIEERATGTVETELGIIHAVTLLDASVDPTDVHSWAYLSGKQAEEKFVQLALKYTDWSEDDARGALTNGSNIHAGDISVLYGCIPITSQ